MAVYISLPGATGFEASTGSDPEISLEISGPLGFFTQVTRTTELTGTSRITKAGTYDLTGISRVLQTLTPSLTGRAKINLHVNEDLTGASRIKTVNTSSLTGKSAIVQRITQDVTGRGRLLVSEYVENIGKGRILRSFTSDITGIASIKLQPTQDLTGLARLLNSAYTSISGKSRIAYLNVEIQDLVRNLKYPFKDNSPLNWSYNGDSGVFLNSITDASFTVFNQTIITPTLTAISWVKGGVQAEDTFNITLNIGTDVELPFNITSDVLVRELENITIRLEVNTLALSNFFRDNFNGSCELTFNDTFCVSTITYASPTVNTLALINYDTLFEEITDYVDFREGANLQFTGTNNLTLNVIAGVGTGLYDACGLLSGIIYKINDIATEGNFIITSDSCSTFNTQLNEGHTELLLGNKCLPSCTNEELKNFAYCLNRVRDGLLDLANYATQTKNNFDAVVAGYRTQIEAQTEVKAIYLKGEAVTKSNAMKNFHAVAFAVYSPTKAVTPAEFTVTFDPFFTVVDRYLTQDGTKQKVTSGFTRALKCNDVVFYSLNLENTKDITGLNLNRGEGKFDVTAKVVSNNSESFFVLPLLSDIPNFTVSLVNQLISGVRYLTFDVDLIGAGTHISTLDLEIHPTEFISGELVLNETTVIPVNNHGFVNQAINYNQKATVNLEYKHTNTNTPTSIYLTLTTSLGIVRKTISTLL